MQTREEILESIMEMLTGTDDVYILERIYRHIKYIDVGKESSKEEIYKYQIIETVGEIEDQEILLKIYTVVKTHLAILKEKEREN